MHMWPQAQAQFAYGLCCVFDCACAPTRRSNASHVSRWAACSMQHGYQLACSTGSRYRKPKCWAAPMPWACISVRYTYGLLCPGFFTNACICWPGFSGTLKYICCTQFPACYTDNRFTYLGQAKPLCILPSCTKSCLMLPMVMQPGRYLGICVLYYYNILFAGSTCGCMQTWHTL